MIKRSENRMMYIKKGHKNTHGHMGIYILLVVISGIFMYYIYSYIMIYRLEQREQKEILQMENNLFPSILTNIYIPYLNTDNLAPDIFLSATAKLGVSDNHKNYKNSHKGDCILSIPDIELEKIVYTGANRLEHLKEYGLATAADNMHYANGGNYIICGHASRLYGHSLNRIREIQKGTLIYIKTSDCIDRYIVDKVTFENMNETDRYCNQTLEQRITIISCAKYISKESYIVIQAIPN